MTERLTEAELADIEMVLGTWPLVEQAFPGVVSEEGRERRATLLRFAGEVRRLRKLVVEGVAAFMSDDAPEDEAPAEWVALVMEAREIAHEIRGRTESTKR